MLWSSRTASFELLGTADTIAGADARRNEAQRVLAEFEQQRARRHGLSKGMLRRAADGPNTKCH